MGVTVFKHLDHHLCVKKSDSELFQCQVYVYVCWNFKTKSHKIQTNLLFINRQGNSVWKDNVWGMIKKVKKKILLSGLIYVGHFYTKQCQTLKSYENLKTDYNLVRKEMN